MKIALATDGAVISAHFGHCSEFTVVTVENGKTVGTERVANPEHQPGFLPEYLSGLGVSCIIAGGMGPRAQELFAAKGIQTIVGASGSVTKVLGDYLAGSLEVGERACDHADSSERYAGGQAEGHEGHGSCSHGGHNDHHGHSCSHGR